jgi:hypothetical protein
MKTRYPRELPVILTPPPSLIVLRVSDREVGEEREREEACWMVREDPLIIPKGVEGVSKAVVFRVKVRVRVRVGIRLRVRVRFRVRL